jgi:hypothetical protein
MPNGFHRRAVLQTDRREYRRITGHGLDCASASSGDVNENLSESTSLEKSQTGSVAVASVFKVDELMESTLRKPSSQLNQTVTYKIWTTHAASSMSSICIVSGL